MVWTAEPTKLEACNLLGTIPSYTAIRRHHTVSVHHQMDWHTSVFITDYYQIGGSQYSWTVNTSLGAIRRDMSDSSQENDQRPLASSFYSCI